MAYTYHLLKDKTIADLREIAKGVQHEAVQGYTQMNKEHLLVALCTALNVPFHEHHDVVGIDKPALKARIRALKKERDAAIEAGDRKKLEAVRRAHPPPQPPDPQAHGIGTVSRPAGERRARVAKPRITADVLPLSDAPNPGGRPYVTYGLIALNVLVYLLVSLPLSGTPPDPDDPALPAYLQVVREQLPPGVPLRAVLNSLSAYDLYVFEHGYKPAAPQVAGPLLLAVPARRVHAPVREHAVPVDLRRQRRVPARPAGVPVLVPRHGRRRDAVLRAVLAGTRRCRWSARRAPSPACSGSTSSGSRATRCGCSCSSSRSS